MLFMAAIFTACPNPEIPKPDPDPEIPKIIESAPVSFTLDAYQPVGTRTQILNFLEYFDTENVPGEISFFHEVTKGNTDVITATRALDRITVTARGAGEAVIRLNALVDEEVKTSVSVTFLVKDSSPKTVSFPSSNQVTFTGASSASPSKDYTFTATPKPDYIVENAIKATYKIGSGDSREITGTKISDTNVYNFTIPAAEITGNIQILGVSGLTQDTSPYSPVVFTATGDFEINGGIKAYTNKNYTFTVTVPSYYSTPSVTYKVGSGAEKTINGIKAGGDMFVIYDLSVPMADLADGQTLNILGVGNLSLNTFRNMPDSFWEADAWEDLAAGPASQPKPMLNETESTLTFTNTIIRRQGAACAPNLSASTSTDSWSQLSFMVQTNDVINMLFFATSGTKVNNITSPTAWGTSDNWIRLFTDASGNILMSTGQVPVAALAKAGNIKYNAGEWMRVDLVYCKISDNLAQIRLFINGVWAKLEPAEESHNWFTINKGYADCTIATPNYGDRAAVWARNSSISFKPVK